jgi:hypothetical protein
LLVDSWLVSAGGAGVAVLGVVLESVEEEVPAGCAVSAAAGAASVAGVAAGGSGRAFGLPGVTVSTVAVFPMLEVGATLAFGCNPKPMVSSPVSLAGVIVGGPLRAAVETSGLVFRKVTVRFILPGRSADCSFCIRATAVGSGGGTGTPNLTSLFLASPARAESG